jgi:two-component system sensor histidine kinase/response regulator
MRVTVTLLIFYSITYVLPAQDKKIIDSLNNLYQRKQADTARILVLNEIAKQYYRSDPDTAIALAQQALAEAEKNSFDKGKARAYNVIGLGYWVKSNHTEALIHYEKSLPFFARANDKEGYAFGLNNIGLIYYYQNNFQLAAEYYQKALALQQENGNQEGIGLALNNIGLNYETQGDLKLALEYYQSALQIYQKAGIQIGTGQSLTNIGYVYFNLGNYKEALSMQERAASIQEKINDKSTLISTLLCIAEIHQRQKQYDKSIAYAQRALQIAEEMKSGFDMREATRVLYETTKAQRNFASSLAYFEAHKKLNDSIFSIENNKAIASLESKAALERKQKEIEVLEKERAMQQMLNYLVIAGLLSLAVLVFFILRNRRKLQHAYNELESANNKLMEVKEEVEMQAEMLSKSNQTKDKIFSIVSHDLRSPLNSLRSVIGMVENKEMSVEELKHFVPELSKRIVHATDIAEELLHWSRSQMDVIEINPVPFDVEQVLSKKADRFSQRARDKNIRLEVKIERPVSYAFADIDMVKTVLRNLISNAIKFCSSGSVIMLNACQQGNHVKICVVDNGTGIKPEHLSKLFNQHGFTTTGTSNESGTGLGLMLCKEFIEKNSGTIWVESEWGKGSSFCFTLPLHNNHLQ